MTSKRLTNQTIRFMVQKRAAIYVRVSGRTQAEKGTSLVTQEEEALKFCRAHKYIVRDEHIYREVHTAREYYERQELAKLLDAAVRGEFDIVIVYAYDRLARKQMHQAVIIDKLQRYNIQVASVTEPQVDETPVGQFLRNTYGFVAELENEKRIERTQRGIQKRIAEGELMGSARPLYGYKWADPTPGKKTYYVLNEDVICVGSCGVRWTEAKVVEHCFAMAKEGYTHRAIAKFLTVEGIPSPNGKPRWRSETVSRILGNRFYMGEATAKRYKITREGGKRHVSVRPDEEHIPLPKGLVPAIVDRETFEAVQVRMQKNKAEAVRNKQHEYNALLNYGIAVCGYCGSHMHVRYIHERKIQYRCTRSNHYHEDCPGVIINMGLLDEIVWQHVVRIIKNPSLVAQKLEAQKRENPVNDELIYIDKRLAEIDEELDNLLKIGQKAKTESLKEKTEVSISLLEDEQTELLARKATLLPVELTWEEEQARLEEFKRWCANAEKELPKATFARKRQAVEQFRVKVLVRRRDPISRQPVIEINDNPLAVVMQTS